MESTNQNAPMIVPTTGSEVIVPPRPTEVPAMRPANCAVSVVGPVVRDTVVMYVDSAALTSKRECLMSDSFGGGALNVTRAVGAYGGSPVPSFLIGKDSAGESMKDELGDEFPHAGFAAGYETSRRSHVRSDGITDTTRPPLTMRRLPSHLRNAIARTPVTVVAPLAAADYEFTADALGAAHFGIWQPSLPQLVDPTSAQRLMPLAKVMVLNDDEAREATGCDDPLDAIMALHDAGCRGVIVTSRAGALARINGNWQFAPAHDVRAVRTSKAGDTFTGVFALAKASGRTTRQALELGQAAAARHVTEQTPLNDLDQLAAWARTEPKIKLVRRAAKVAINGRRAVSVSVAVAAMILAIAVLR